MSMISNMYIYGWVQKVKWNSLVNNLRNKSIKYLRMYYMSIAIINISSRIRYFALINSKLEYVITIWFGACIILSI